MFEQSLETGRRRVGGRSGATPAFNSVAFVNRVAHGPGAHIGQSPSQRHDSWPDGKAADGRGSNPLGDAAEPCAGRSGGTTSGPVSGGVDGSVAGFFPGRLRGRVGDDSFWGLLSLGNAFVLDSEP